MKKKIASSIFGIGLAILISGKLLANEYYTTRSTATYFSSRTIITVESITLSTGSPGTYVLLVDTKLPSGAENSVNLANNVSIATFTTESQWFAPPFEFMGATAAFSGQKTYTLGYKPKNGLVIFQSAFGGVVTIVVSRTNVPAANRGALPHDSNEDTEQLANTTPETEQFDITLNPGRVYTTDELVRLLGSKREFSAEEVSRIHKRKE